MDRPFPPEKLDFALHYCKNRFDLSCSENVLGDCSLRGKSAGWASTYKNGTDVGRVAKRANQIYGARVVPMTWTEKARQNTMVEDEAPDPFRMFMGRSRGSKLREAELTNRSWEPDRVHRSRISLVLGSFPRAQTVPNMQKKRRRMYSAGGSMHGGSMMPNATRNPFSTGSSQWMIPLRPFLRPYTSEDRITQEKTEPSLITLHGLDEFFPKPVSPLCDDVECSRDQHSMWQEIHDSSSLTAGNHEFFVTNDENSSLQTLVTNNVTARRHSSSKLDILISEISKDFCRPSLLTSGPADWAERSLAPLQESRISLASTLVSDFDNTKMHPGRHGRRRRSSDIRDMAHELAKKTKQQARQKSRETAVGNNNKSAKSSFSTRNRKEDLPDLYQ